MRVACASVDRGKRLKDLEKNIKLEKRVQKNEWTFHMLLRYTMRKSGIPSIFHRASQC